MPSLTQVIKIDVEDGKLRCERQAEYGYDTVLVELPAVISVGDAINEPRYPSLKAIMGAKKKPLETKGTGDVGIEAGRVGYDNARAHCSDFKAPAAKEPRPHHRGRGHDGDGRADPRLARREEAAGMSSILVYALHYEGAFNKNSLGAVSEGARLAGELGGECHAVVVGDKAGLSDDLCASLGRLRRRQGLPRRGARGPRPARRRRDGEDHRATHGHGYALFGGGLLGFEIGAGLTARLDAGVCMEVTSVRVEDGKLVSERPILQDSSVSDVHYRSDVGVIIGRLNAFEVTESGDGAAAVEDVAVEFAPHSLKAQMVQRGEQRGADVNIEDADILVAGGRGLGKAEGFDTLEELAGALGGAVAATRAVVDAGWYSYSAQIGQTGKTVSPKLYLAAGISGAIQHKVGMQGSENIVAINKDANAPIFEFSDLGIVGDLNKIVPKLTEAVKARKGG